MEKKPKSTAFYEDKLYLINRKSDIIYQCDLCHSQSSWIEIEVQVDPFCTVHRISLSKEYLLDKEMRPLSTLCFGHDLLPEHNKKDFFCNRCLFEFHLSLSCFINMFPFIASLGVVMFSLAAITSSSQFGQIFGMTMFIVLLTSLTVNCIFCVRCKDYFIEHRQYSNWFAQGVTFGVWFSWWVAIPFGLLFAALCTTRQSTVEIQTDVIVALLSLYSGALVFWIGYKKILIRVLSFGYCLDLNAQLYEFAATSALVLCGIVVYLRFGNWFSSVILYYFR